MNDAPVRTPVIVYRTKQEPEGFTGIPSQHFDLSNPEYLKNQTNIWQLSKNLHQIRNVRLLNGGQLQNANTEFPKAGDKRHHKLTDPDKKKCYGEETRMPHRLIEKKRRDRINCSIGCLKDLLPDDMKTENARPLEKAVVLELTIKYIRQLQKSVIGQDTKPSTQDLDHCIKSNESSYMAGYQDAVAKLQSIFPAYQDSLIARHRQQQVMTTSFEIKREPNIEIYKTEMQTTPLEADRNSSSGYESGDNKKLDRETESPIDVVGINETSLPFTLMTQVPYPLQFNSFLPSNRLFKKT